MRKQVTLKYSDFPQPEEVKDPNEELLSMIKMGLRINPSISAKKLGFTAQALHSRLKRLESQGFISSRMSTIKSKDGSYRKGLIYERINNDSNNRNRPGRPKRS